VFYNKKTLKWYVQRRSKDENTNVSNGYFDDEKTAAHASDTLARKLIENGKQKLILNFPDDDHIEVYSKKKTKKSKFIGVLLRRWSQNDNKKVYKGCHNDAETAAHASDTLARKLMENSKQKLKLNFPDDLTEVYPEEKNISSKFIGVSFDKNKSKWRAQRWSKYKNKTIGNGHFEDEETAAHASDTLARKLIENGEHGHELNFPDDITEVYPEKKNTFSKFIGVSYNTKESKWKVLRWRRHEKKKVYNGTFDDEETAAHVSDAFARKLMKDGEQKLKLNFPGDLTEKQNKRKRQKDLSFEHPQNN
jgi:hypothetical protein